MLNDLLKQGSDIIKGYVNELLDNNKDISEKRMEICRSCPLFKDSFGGICNPNLFMNPETLEVSEYKRNGFKSGCGCRLKAKTTLKYAHCPLNRW